MSDLRPESSYVEYLIDANTRITEREQAVRIWEFHYDGCNPPPDVYDQPMAPVTQIQVGAQNPFLPTKNKFHHTIYVSNE